MTLFAQLINLNFELIVKTVEDTQSITLELPGIPPILIPGFPGVQIPGLSPFDIGIQAERQSLEAAWIGGRILRGVPYDKRRATGQYGGTDGVNVGGTDISIPGTDPFLVTMQYVQQNFEILIQLVPSVTTVPVLLPGAPGSLCNNPNLTPAARQALINEIIDTINTQMREALKGAGGGGGCVPFTVPIGGTGAGIGADFLNDGCSSPFIGAASSWCVEHCVPGATSVNPWFWNGSSYQKNNVFFAGAGASDWGTLGLSYPISGCPNVTATITVVLEVPQLGDISIASMRLEKADGTFMAASATATQIGPGTLTQVLTATADFTGETLAAVRLVWDCSSTLTNTNDILRWKDGTISFS